MNWKLLKYIDHKKKKKKQTLVFLTDNETISSSEGKNEVSALEGTSNSNNSKNKRLCINKFQKLSSDILLGTFWVYKSANTLNSFKISSFTFGVNCCISTVTKIIKTKRCYDSLIGTQPLFMYSVIGNHIYLLLFVSIVLVILKKSLCDSIPGVSCLNNSSSI
jgi:hypothetical protein